MCVKRPLKHVIITAVHLSVELYLEHYLELLISFIIVVTSHLQQASQANPTAHEYDTPPPTDGALKASSDYAIPPHPRYVTFFWPCSVSSIA